MVEASTKLTETASKLGVLDAIKKSFMSQPDVAAMKLAAVLAELQKTLLAFETEAVRFVSVVLTPEQRADDENRKALVSLEGQQLWARLSSARGHCGKIKNIYDNYLNPWFQKHTGIRQAERDQLKVLFDDLSDSDGRMVDLVNKAAWWLGDAAKAVLEVFNQGRIDEANKLIGDARQELLPARRAITNMMATLQNLEAAFIEVSRVS
jgi:hypothetical protein